MRPAVSWLQTIVTLTAVALVVAACGDDHEQQVVEPPTIEREVGATSSGQSASLFVLEADGGTAEADGAGTYRMALAGVGGATSFTDRPQRKADSETVERFVEAWERRAFGDDPPNAALTIGQGSDARTAIVTMRDPQVDDEGALTFSASVIEPDEAPDTMREQAGANPVTELPPTFDRASLFVDPSADQRFVQVTMIVSGANGLLLQMSLDTGTEISLDQGPVAFISNGPGAVSALSVSSARMSMLAAGVVNLQVPLPLLVEGAAITGTVSGDFGGGQLTMQPQGGRAVALTAEQPFRIPLP